MRLVQLLAVPATSFSSSATSAATPSLPPAAPTPAPAAKNSTSPDSPASASIIVPYLSIGGFVECPWYRRALCIADEFVHTQVEQAEQLTRSAASTGAVHSDSAIDSSDSNSQPAPPPTPLLPPPHLRTRLQSVTLPRQQYRHYLIALHRLIDLRDHYSCPVVLQGTCTLSGTAEQHAADYPLQHGGAGGAGGGGVTGSAVACECRAERLVGGYGELERMLREQYGFVATRCGRLATGSVGGRC